MFYHFYSVLFTCNLLLIVIDIDLNLQAINISFSFGIFDIYIHGYTVNWVMKIFMMITGKKLPVSKSFSVVFIVFSVNKKPIFDKICVKMAGSLRILARNFSSATGAINHVTVIGGGLMGSGIAQVRRLITCFTQI